MTLGTHERPINPQTSIQAWFTGTQDQFLPQGIGGPASSGVRQIDSRSQDSETNLLPYLHLHPGHDRAMAERGSVYTGRALGRLSIDAVLGRTAGLKNGARKPHTIL